MEPINNEVKRGYGGYGGAYGDGGYGGYSNRPVSVFWSRARIQVRRYYNVFCRFGWLLPLTICLGVCLAAWVVSQMPPDYISQSRMIVAGQMELPKEDAIYDEERDNYYGNQRELMESLDVQKGAAVRVQALHPDLPPVPVSLSVDQEPHASIFVLSVEASNGPFAQAYLEAVMNEYIELKNKQRLQESDSTTLAVQEQVVKLEKEIDADDEEMQAFQSKNNIGYLQNAGNASADYLAQLERKLANLKIDYNLLQLLDLDQNLDREQLNAAAQTATQTTSSATSETSGATDNQSLGSMGPIVDYQKAKQHLELLKAQRAEMAERLRPAHPDMMAMDEQIKQENNLIETLRGESVDALKTRRDSIKIQIDNLNGVIAEWQKKASDTNVLIAEFNRIKAKSDRDKEEHDHQLSYMTSLTETKNTDQDPMRIMDHASEGVSIKPGWFKIILIGIGGGLLVGLAILFCIDQFDDRIGSFLELHGHFTETVLGQIPHDKFEGDASLLRHNDDRLALLESFRSLRSSLIFFPVEGARPKTLIVTSGLPNEGKTTISANLAITLAFSGARTLVVDADMRRGKLSKLFGVIEHDGLSTVLMGVLPWQEVVHQTTVDNLSLLGCGPALKHPAEHLLGKVADQFLKDVYEQFDYVIFDSPPVTLLDDTLSLAPKVDGTMIVVRFGHSSIRTTRRTIDLLSQRQANILGLICNDVDISESEYNYGYYYRQTVEAYHKEARATA